MGFRGPRFKNPFADVSTGNKTDTELAELIFNDFKIRCIEDFVIIDGIASL